MNNSRLPPLAFKAALEIFATEETKHTISIFTSRLDRMQVFDFNEPERAGDVDKTLAAELWHKRLLRLPFRECMYTFKIANGLRVNLLCLEDVAVTHKQGTTETATAFLVVSQREGVPLPDAFVWFESNGTHIHCGSVQLSPCKDETDESFQKFVLSSIARVITLSMLLNTKGLPKRHEPVPVKLNKKRAESGKPPIPAVTYIDLSKISFGSHQHGGGGEKAMHLRRGHIRRFDDGTSTWVRDCIVKADGELKQRERYQLRPSGN